MIRLKPTQKRYILRALSDLRENKEKPLPKNFSLASLIQGLRKRTAKMTRQFQARVATVRRSPATANI